MPDMNMTTNQPFTVLPRATLTVDQEFELHAFLSAFAPQVAADSQDIVIALSGSTITGVTTAVKTLEPMSRQSLWLLETHMRPNSPSELIEASVAKLTCLLRDRWLEGESRSTIGVFRRQTLSRERLPRLPLGEYLAAPDGLTPLYFFEIGRPQASIRHVVHYFPNSQFLFPGESNLRPRAKSIPGAEPLPCRFVWGPKDPTLANAIVDFWVREGAIQDRAKAEDRVGQVTSISLDGERIAAVSSVFPVEVKQLRFSALGFRCFVGKDYRLGHQSMILTEDTYQQLNRLFTAGSLTPRLPGIVYTLQNPAQGNAINEADAPRTGFFFMGFDDRGFQIRARWFSGATAADCAPPVSDTSYA